MQYQIIYTECLKPILIAVWNNQMNKLIQTFEQNSLCADVLLDTYGVDSHEYFDMVFVAPSWSIDKVFNSDTIKIEHILQTRFSDAFRIFYNNKKYLFIQLQIGAANMIDFCLSCHKMQTKDFVFIGSCGALVPAINIGDIVIPNCVISGNSATLYLHEKLDPANMFETIHSSPELNDKVLKAFNSNKLHAIDETAVSMDSITAEYIHLDEFRNMGAKVIEMEAATFLASMKSIDKNAVAVLLVSDNSSTGQHLVGSTDKDKVSYHNIRNQIQNVLLKL